MNEGPCFPNQADPWVDEMRAGSKRHGTRANKQVSWRIWQSIRGYPEDEGVEYKSTRGVYSLSRAITWADDVRDSFPGSRDGGSHDFIGGGKHRVGAPVPEGSYV